MFAPVFSSPCSHVLAFKCHWYAASLLSPDAAPWRKCWLSSCSIVVFVDWIHCKHFLLLCFVFMWAEVYASLFPKALNLSLRPLSRLFTFAFPDCGKLPPPVVMVQKVSFRYNDSSVSDCYWDWCGLVSAWHGAWQSSSVSIEFLHRPDSVAENHESLQIGEQPLMNLDCGRATSISMHLELILFHCAPLLHLSPVWCFSTKAV